MPYSHLSNATFPNPPATHTRPPTLSGASMSLNLRKITWQPPNANPRSCFALPSHFLERQHAHIEQVYIYRAHLRCIPFEVANEGAYVKKSVRLQPLVLKAPEPTEIIFRGGINLAKHTHVQLILTEENK